MYIRSLMLILWIGSWLYCPAQDSSAETYLRDRLMVYYVEDPSSDQYRLINPNEITSGQPLFGGNPQMEIAQNLIHELFIPSSDTDFQEEVIQLLGNQERPAAMFFYFERGPLEEAVASANWTNCHESGYFTSCTTTEEGDEYERIVHYGTHQMNADGIDTAKSRILALLGSNNNSELVVTLPAGKGMFTENLRGAAPTSEAFVNRIREAGITWIAFQGAHQDVSGENLDNINRSRRITEEYISAFKNAVPNAKVYVWGWPMANSSPSNIRAFVDRLIEKLEWVRGDGLILDIEGVAHGSEAVAWNRGNKTRQMQTLMDYAIQQAHARNMTVGVSSFGTSVPGFPWEQMSRADFGIPQLYSPNNRIYNPETSAVIARTNYVSRGISLWEDRGFRGKIIVASALITDTRKTADQVSALLDITRPHLPSRSIIWWTWRRSVNDEKWDLVKNFSFPDHLN